VSGVGIETIYMILVIGDPITTILPILDIGNNALLGLGVLHMLVVMTPNADDLSFIYTPHTTTSHITHHTPYTIHHTPYTTPSYPVTTLGLT